MKSDCPKKGAGGRAAATSMPRLATPPVKARGSNNLCRWASAGDGSRGTAANSGLISGRTVRLRIRGDAARTPSPAAPSDVTTSAGPHGPSRSGRSRALPLEALWLFGGDRAQQWAGVVVVPDHGRQVLAIGLDGNRLLVDVEVDVLEGPDAELAFPEAGLQPAIPLTSPKPPGGGLVDRLQDPKLGFEFLDDDHRSALELQFRDPAAQIVDLEQVFVHGSSLCKIRRNEQALSEAASGRQP